MRSVVDGAREKGKFPPRPRESLDRAAAIRPSHTQDVLMADDQEPMADAPRDDPGLLGQLPKLSEARSAADIRGRMRNVSESALGNRGIERPASLSKAFALSTCRVRTSQQRRTSRTGNTRDPVDAGGSRRSCLPADADLSGSTAASVQPRSGARQAVASLTAIPDRPTLRRRGRRAASLAPPRRPNPPSRAPLWSGALSSGRFRPHRRKGLAGGQRVRGPPGPFPLRD
jgi:hypothetical protein